MTHVHTISAVARLEVKFNECDPMGIVWHGNYLKYFEEGREEFGKVYGLDFMEFFNNGVAVPIVHVACDYKKSLTYRDIALVEIYYCKTPAAKIIFDYIIRKESTNEVVCKGTTTQVFVNRHTMELSLVVPAFFAKWLKTKGTK